MSEERQLLLSGRAGIFLDRPIHMIPKDGLQDARNVRIREGRIERQAMGWLPFFDIVLNGPVLLIDEFVLRTGVRLMIFGTDTDLYRMDSTTGDLDFLTPRFATAGGAAVTNGSDIVVAGPLLLTNTKVGDSIHIGSTSQTDPAAIWYDIVEVIDNTHIRLSVVYAGTTSLAVDFTIRKRFTGTLLDPWSSDVFYDADPTGDDLWFATNGVDWVVSWDGNATEVTSESALGFTCRSLGVFSGMMLYVDLLESGDRKSNVVRNSAIGDPRNVSTLEAAEVNGTDIADRLVASIPLADVTVNYGAGSTSIAQFIGPPIYWVVRTVSRTVGALSRRGIVDRGDFHAFPARDGAYTFDGVQMQPFAAHVFTTVARTLDLERLPQAITFWDMENAEVFWLLPTNADGSDALTVPQIAYTEHYQERVSDRLPVPFMARDLPATALGEFSRTEDVRFDEVVAEFIAQDYAWVDRFFSAAFPTKLMGMADGSVMELGADDSQDGEAINSFARGGRFPLVDGVSRGSVRELEVHTEPKPDATHALDVRLYAADRPEGPATLVSTVEADLTGVPVQRWYRPRCQARYLDIEIGTDGANEGFAASGLRLRTRDAGRR